MTRSVLSPAILLAAFTGSLLLTEAVRSDTADDSQATKPQDNGCCPATDDSLYEAEYDYCYEGDGYDTPQDTPKCDEAEGIASDEAGEDTGSASEVDAEEYTYEDVDYWYDSETDEYYEYDFGADDLMEEMAVEETAKSVEKEANPFRELVQDEASILLEDISIAPTEGKQAHETVEYEHTYDEMYDYEYAYDCYWDDCYGEQEDGSYLDEESPELVAETTESSSDVNAESPEYWYEYWEALEQEYADSLEVVVEHSEQVVVETVAEPAAPSDEFDDYWHEYWEVLEQQYADSLELVVEHSEQVVMETTAEATAPSDELDDYWYEYWEALEQEYADSMEAVVEHSEQVAAKPTELVIDESDDLDYWYEYWDEYDYYDEVAEEVELVESLAEGEDGELGADAELECWMEADLEEMMVAFQRQEQADNDREAILSVARTLDRVGTALQALSRELTEMADAEVADLPASDTTIQR